MIVKFKKGVHKTPGLRSDGVRFIKAIKDTELEVTFTKRAKSTKVKGKKVKGKIESIKVYAHPFVWPIKYFDIVEK